MTTVATKVVKIKPKPEGLDKPYVGKIIKTMSTVHLAALPMDRWPARVEMARRQRLSPRHSGALADHVGRKSGLPRTLPLLFIEEGNKLIVVASKGGLPDDPLWYKNLVATPDCEVQIKRRKMKMKARTASPEERAALWPKLVAHYPDFASYATWTDRIIPVVILEPAE